MKRKWSSIIAVLFVLLVLASTAVPSLAQREQEEGTATVFIMPPQKHA